MPETKTAAPRRRMPKPPTLRVWVTDDVIREATRSDSSACMIADAIKAQVPHVTRVEVDLQLITMTDTERRVRYSYLTPAWCQDALVKFDQGEDVAPFDFELPPKALAIAKPMAPRVGRGEKRERQFLHDGAKLNAQIEGGAGPGTAKPRTLVDGRVVAHPSKRGAAPPVAVLSTRKGRVRKYGMRQLKP